VRFHQLAPWQEIFGTFQSITIDDDAVTVFIAGYPLRYGRRTPEAEFLITHLTPRRIGKLVGILNIEQEFRIRWPEEQMETMKPSNFIKWYCRTYSIPLGW